MDHNCYDRPVLINGCYHYWRKDSDYFRINNLPVVVSVYFREFELNNNDYPSEIYTDGLQLWYNSKTYYKSISRAIDCNLLYLL